MAYLATGERVGAFFVFIDDDGLRHAVRCQAVMALSDLDGVGSDTILQLTGNRAIKLRRQMQEVLEWFRGGWGRGRTECGRAALETGMLKLGRPGHAWIARCQGCHRKGLLLTQKILTRFGEREPLVRITERLK